MALVYCESCEGNHQDRACIMATIGPRKSYTVESGDRDGSSCYFYAVYSRAEVERVLGKSAEDEDPERLTAELVPWAAFSGGVGRWFGTVPFLRIRKRNIIVRQFRAMDI